MIQSSEELIARLKDLAQQLGGELRSTEIKCEFTAPEDARAALPNGDDAGAKVNCLIFSVPDADPSTVAAEIPLAPHFNLATFAEQMNERIRQH